MGFSILELVELLREAGGRAFYRYPDGTIKELSLECNNSSFSIATMTNDSIENMERKQSSFLKLTSCLV